MVVSVKETKSNPYYQLFEGNKEGWLQKSKEGSFTSRQECPEVYELNGAIYIISVEVLKQKPLNQFTHIRKYLMDEYCSQDIDTPLDWIIAETIVKAQQ
jgi:N-acylneuraminate cytidylyltransferase